MKRITVTLLATISIIANVFAQEPQFQWASSLSGSIGSISGSSIKVDSFGNVYTTGIFYGTIDFDPGSGAYNITSNGNQDIYISKFNSQGSFLWAKNIGGNGADLGFGLSIDTNGNLYLAGYFEGTVDFDPGSGVFDLTSHNNGDVFILKLDSSGSFVWANNFGSNIHSSEGLSISVDNNGNTYTTGYFYGTVDFNPGSGVFDLTSNGYGDIFILKLDSSGSFIWAKSIGGIDGDCGNSLCIDNFGNVYSTGYFYGTVDFNPGSGVFDLTDNGNRDIFILKLNSQGSFVWAKNIGGIINDIGYSIAVDNSGYVYTTGYFEETVDFNPGSGVYNITSIGNEDIFILKLDSLGDFIWAKSMGGASTGIGNSIAVDFSENVYTTGFFSGTFDFGPGSGNSLSSQGDDDIFVSKLDSQGNFIWAHNIGGNSFDRGYSVCLDNYKNIYATGDFIGSVDFDPGSGVYTLTSNITYGGVYILKLSQCLETTVNINETACFSYDFNGNTLVNSGTYYDTVLNTAGCDSIIILDLIINTVDTGVVFYNNTLISNAVGATYQWIICSNNSPIPGETNQGFSPEHDGVYAVIVTENGCIDTSACYTVNINSVYENDFGPNIKIYPNPTLDQILIDFGSNYSNGTVEMLNTTGKLMIQKKIENNKNLLVDIHNLSIGVYIILIKVDNKPTVFRRIVKGIN